MFFIFGTNTTRLAAEPISMNCNYCHQENTMALVHNQRYFHIFWIPLFPLWRESFSTCTHCKQLLKLNQMDPELKAQALSTRKQLRTPWFTYIILLVIVLFILISVITHTIKG